MRKRTREILALVLLGVLAIVAASAMGYYILVGHNWNVTASHIDDTIGQMEGYTVFLYEGTNVPEEERESLASSAVASTAQPALPASSASAVESASASSSGFSTQSASGGDRSSSSEVPEPLAVSEVASSYRDKGATVFRLYPSDLYRYNEPFVVAKNGKRVGLFSLAKPCRKTVARRAVLALEKAGADYIVAITDDSRLCDMGVRGITVIVCDDDEGSSPDGGYVGNSFCTGVPAIGEVEAVIMSPSGVFSSKTITEL